MELTCIVCPAGCHLTAQKTDGAWTVSGNTCPKGRDFAISEATNPTRTLCSTVKTADPTRPRLPVRTGGEIPLGMIYQVMEVINAIEVKGHVSIGDVIVSNVLGTGVDIIATANM
jgi:CxxC motif-containing protein